MEKESLKNGFWFIGNNQIIGIFYLRLLIWVWKLVGCGEGMGGWVVDFWLSFKVEIFGFLDGLWDLRLFIWVWKLWVVGGWVVLVILLSNKVQIFGFYDLRLLIWSSVLTIFFAHEDKGVKGFYENTQGSSKITFDI